MKENNIFRLILIFLVYMNFEGFFKLYFEYHPIAHAFKYVFALIFLLICVFQTGFPKTSLNAPIFLFTVLVFLQFINPLMWQGKGILLSIGGALFHLGFIPLYFISYKILDEGRVKKIMILLLALATFSAFIAHIEFFLFPNDSYVKYLPYTPEMIRRIRGSIMHGPVVFGPLPPTLDYLVASVIALIFFYQSNKKNAFYLLLSLNLLLALFLSGIRIHILTGLLVFTLLLLLGSKFTIRKFTLRTLRGILFACLAVILSVKALLPLFSGWNMWRYSEMLLNPIGTYIQRRGFTWIDMLENSLSHPLGVGLRGGMKVDEIAYGISKTPINMHDNYLLILTGEIGAIILLPLFWMYLTVIKRFFSNYRKLTGLSQFTNIGFFSLIFGFMVSNGFMAGGMPNHWLFWIFSAVLFNLGKKDTIKKTRKQAQEMKSVNVKKPMLSDSYIIGTFYKILEEKDHSMWLRESQIHGLILKLKSYITNSKAFNYMKKLLKR